MYFLSINKIRQDVNPAEVGAAIASHIAWTRQELAAGRLAQAGKWGEAGGMAIVRAGDIGEAERIVGRDPLVAAGLVDCETAPLYPDVPIG